MPVARMCHLRLSDSFGFYSRLHQLLCVTRLARPIPNDPTRPTASLVEQTGRQARSCSSSSHIKPVKLSIIPLFGLPLFHKVSPGMAGRVTESQNGSREQVKWSRMHCSGRNEAKRRLLPRLPEINSKPAPDVTELVPETSEIVLRFLG